MKNCCNFDTTTLTNVEPQKHIARLHLEIDQKNGPMRSCTQLHKASPAAGILKPSNIFLILGSWKGLETLSFPGLLKSDQNTRSSSQVKIYQWISAQAPGFLSAPMWNA